MNALRLRSQLDLSRWVAQCQWKRSNGALCPVLIFAAEIWMQTASTQFVVYLLCCYEHFYWLFYGWKYRCECKAWLAQLIIEHQQRNREEKRRYMNEVVRNSQQELMYGINGVLHLIIHNNNNEKRNCSRILLFCEGPASTLTHKLCSSILEVFNLRKCAHGKHHTGYRLTFRMTTEMVSLTICYSFLSSIIQWIWSKMQNIWWRTPNAAPWYNVCDTNNIII